MELKLYYETEDSRSLLALHFEEDRLSYYDKNENLIFTASYEAIDIVRLERTYFNLAISIDRFEAEIEIIDLEYIDNMFDRIASFLKAHASDKCDFLDCY